MIIVSYKLNKMSKTAVSMLQDVCMKLGTLPIYSEVSSVVGSHQSQFISKVSWKNYISEGIGNNKKEAKQNAAEKMLLLLLSSNEIPEKIIFSFPNLKVDFKLNTDTITNDMHAINLSDSIRKQVTNYIGLLNEYCHGQNLSVPVYENVSTSGPSHLPMFTVSCTVGSVRHEGCANTKQAAKHQAAKMVLENLNVELNTETSNTMDNLNVQFMKVSLDQPKYDKLKEQEIVANYVQITKKPVQFKSCIKLDDYVEVLTDLCHKISVENKNLLSTMYNTSSSVDSIALKAIINEAFKTSIEEISFEAISGDPLIGLKLNTHPVIFQFGMGKTIEQARKNALRKLLEYIFLLLQ